MAKKRTTKPMKTQARKPAKKPVKTAAPKATPVGTKGAKGKRVAKPAAAKAAPGEKSNGKARRFDLAARIAALPETAAKTPPTTPIALALQEAHDVAVAANAARKKLLTLPFEHALLEELPARIAALRSAEAAWHAVKGKAKAAAPVRREAEALKHDMLAAGRYLLRHDAQAQGELDAIAEGDGLADLIDDLYALSDFFARRSKSLTAALVPGGPSRAVVRAASLASELANASSDERADATAVRALELRNQCFVLVTDAVHEVRAAARYALRGDARALAPFRHSWHPPPPSTGSLPPAAPSQASTSSTAIRTAAWPTLTKAE